MQNFFFAKLEASRLCIWKQLSVGTVCMFVERLKNFRCHHCQYSVHMRHHRVRCQTQTITASRPMCHRTNQRQRQSGRANNFNFRRPENQVYVYDMRLIYMKSIFRGKKLGQNGQFWKVAPTSPDLVVPSPLAACSTASNAVTPACGMSLQAYSKQPPSVFLN